MSDQHFYRTLGMEFGPVTLAEIQKLLDQGILGIEDQYCEAGGPWREVAWLVNRENSPTPVAEQLIIPPTSGPAASDPVIPHPPELDSALPRPATNLEMQQLYLDCLNRHPRAAVRLPSPSLRQNRGIIVSGFKTLIRYVVETVGTILDLVLSALARVFGTTIAWGVLAALFTVLLISQVVSNASTAFVNQRQIYASLSEILAESKELRSGDFDTDSWDEFQERSQQKLDAFVPSLERNAHSSDPISMSLLWLARDYFPLLLAENNEATTAAEEKIQSLLTRIDADLQKAQRLSRPGDFWVTLMVGVDVLGACAALAYFGRHWWPRSVV